MKFIKKFKKFKGKNFEIIVVISFLLLFITALIADNKVIYLPKFILINVADDKIQDLINTVFSVQATVATVSIAILALLSNIVKESIYGLSVSRYITNDKHYVFKHNHIILMGLILVLLSYCFTAMQFYNAVIFLFFITIFGVIKMARDIFIIFSGDGNLKDDIRVYVIEHYRNLRYLENLKYDVQDTIYENDTRKLKDNFLLIEEIMRKEITINDDISAQILEALKYTYTDSFENIFETGNETKYIFCWEKIIKLYKIANIPNDEENRSKSVDVWEKCRDEFFQTLRKMPFEKLHSSIFSELHDELYKNITDVKKNTHGLESFMLYIYYYSIDKQNNLLTNEDKLFLCRYFFQILMIRMRYGIKDDHDSKDKMKVLLKETLLFIKRLIDKEEKEKFYECFVNEFLKPSYYSKQDNYYLRDLGFCILIYVYYVVGCEKNSEEEQKVFCQSLLNDSNSEVSQFLQNNKINLLTQEYFDEIYSYIRTWEIFSRYEAKYEVIGNTIRDFYIFTTLYESFSEEDLASSLLSILKEQQNYIIYYSSYIKDLDIAKKRYIEFINCIYGSNKLEKQELIDEKFEQLNKIIIFAYKEGEIAKANKIVFTAVQSNEFGEKFKSNINRFLKENLSRYSKFEPISKESIKVENLPYSVQIYNEMTSEYFSQDIIKAYAKTYLADIYSIIFNTAIKRESAKYGTNDKLLKLLPNIAKLNFTPDTVVGNIHLFYADKQRDVLNELVKDKECFEIDYFNNIFMMFDSRQLLIRIIKVDVKIRKYKEDEILRKYEESKKGDLYLFDFSEDVKILITKEELLSIYENKYSILEVNIEFEFSIKQSIIGCGLVII